MCTCDAWHVVCCVSPQELDSELLENFTSQNLRRLFRVFDRNHDTALTHVEFQRGLEERAYCTSRALCCTTCTLCAVLTCVRV